MSWGDVEDLRHRLFTHVSRLAALSIWLGVPFDADLVVAVGAQIDKARDSATRAVIERLRHQIEALEVIVPSNLTSEERWCRNGDYINKWALLETLASLSDPTPTSPPMGAADGDAA
jgi:hypothetical protein